MLAQISSSQCIAYHKARSHTYPQFTAILSVAAGVQYNIDVWVRAGVSFIAKLPLAVVPGCVEDVGISEVKRLIYDVLSAGV